MAVSSDLGDPRDVHPRKKKPVGERLALQALEKHYGHPLRADGPRLQDFRLDVRELTQPLAVRYGWEPYSLANLTDVRGLPASTFKQEL